jgi:hypothetical protein
MINSTISKMIESLADLTINGTLVWKESNPTSKKRYFERTYVMIGDDSTEYSVDIKYSIVNDIWTLEKDPSMWINNVNLPNGMYYIYGNKYDVVKLRDAVLDTYCHDMNPSIQDIEVLFEEMYNNINLSGIRDNKLHNILKE